MWAAGSFEATFQKSVWEFLTKIVSSSWGGLGTSNWAGRDDFYDTFFTVPFLPHNGSALKMAPIIFAITSDWFDVFWSRAYTKPWE